MEVSEWSLAFIIDQSSFLHYSEISCRKLVEWASPSANCGHFDTGTGQGGEPDRRLSFWTPQRARPVIFVTRKRYVCLYDLANTVREIKMSLPSQKPQMRSEKRGAKA